MSKIVNFDYFSTGMVLKLPEIENYFNKNAKKISVGLCSQVVVDLEAQIGIMTFNLNFILFK